MTPIRIRWTDRLDREREHEQRRRQRWALAEQIAALLGDPVLYKEELLRYLRNMSEADLDAAQRRLHRRVVARAEFLERCRRERGWLALLFVWLIYMGWRPRGNAFGGVGYGGRRRKLATAER